MFHNSLIVSITCCVSMILAMVVGNPAVAADNAWSALSERQQSEAMQFAEDYKDFIGSARTALAAIQWTRRVAEEQGYKTFEPGMQVKPGEKYIVVNRDRAACLITVGRRPVREGVRVIGAHVDSPHLTLKPRPVVDVKDFALLQTSYHGGIKRYQWVNIPLALTGRVDKTDGTTVWIELGLKPDDPILILPDLAPHVDGDYRNRNARDVIKAEEMDPIIGSLPEGDENVSEMVMNWLAEHYDITEDDLVSAELMLVPAIAPRDVGVDRALVAGYGHDDRGCSYIAIRAALVVDNPEYTTISYLVNNEEVGSINNTGARTTWFRWMVSELLAATEDGDVSERLLSRTLSRSTLLSADNTTGLNPLYPGVQEATNSAYMHQGFILKLYGQGFNANSEFIAHIRKILDDAGVKWQTHMYKVAGGGGGTIGGFFSVDNMEVIDIGAPLLSMHAPYSVVSKADMYQLFLGCTAYYQDETPWDSMR
jgi:aspartyl aminopeptidase